MAGFDPINLGTVDDDRTGNDFKAGGTKINTMFQELFGVVASIGIKFIGQESDFEIQDATTITLAAATQHIITASFSTAKNFIVKDAAVLTSSSLLGPTLTYTGTGSMFTSVDATFSIRDIRIDHPNAQGFNFTDTVGGLFLFLAEKVRTVSGTKWGTFNDLQTVLIEGSSALDVDDGLTFTGTTSIIISFDKFFMQTTSATFIGVDLGTAISQTIEFDDLILVGPAGSIGIKGAASSANVPVGSVATVSGGNFAAIGTPLDTILVNDIRWDFISNSTIEDSRNAADVHLTGGAETITTGSAGDWQEIGIPGGGGVSWASDIADRFTIGTNGVITYIGERDINVTMSGRATVEKVGGGANVLEVRLALNWDGTSSDAGIEKSRAQTQNADPTTVPIGALMQISQNDNIRVIFSNTDGSANIIASVAALEVSE